MRVLFVGPQPSDSDPLEIDLEFERLAEILDLQPNIVTEIIEPGTLKALEERLRGLQKEPTVLHFSGHGNAFCDLQVERDDDGQLARMVSAEQFNRILTLLDTNIRLLVLNACFTRGLADLAVQSGGVDCVVGMKREIRDQDAIGFSDSFYRSVARGEPVAQAFELAKASTDDHVPYLCWGLDCNQETYRLVNPPAAAFEEGKVIHGKELVELWFRDDVSEVWRTRDPRFSTLPTLYRLFPSWVSDQDFNDAADRVSRLSSLFGSPSPRGRDGKRNDGTILRVVRVYPDRPFVVEYDVEQAKWETLDSYSQKLQRPLTAKHQEQAAQVIQKVAEVVAHALTSPERLVHGMLNPLSVLITGSEADLEVVVADYGLSPMASRDFLNKSPFVSPRRRTANKPGPLDDVYALGALWLSLLLGSGSESQWASFLSWYDPLHRNGMTFEQAKLVASCLNEEPSDRPQSASDLSVEIRRLYKPKAPRGVKTFHPGTARSGFVEDSEEGFVNSIGMEFVRIPASEFMMGSSRDEEGHEEHEWPPHRVRLSGFFISRTVVTRAQYLALKRLEQKQGIEVPLEYVEKDDEYPMTRLALANRQWVPVSWEDGVRFCQRLTEIAEEKHLKGRRYRLPTEAEWEFCCRAGTNTAFNVGSDLTPDYANFKAGPHLDTALGKARSLGPNSFGLFNMHGNVWEYCGDLYSPSYYVQSDSRDPQGPREEKGFWKNWTRNRKARVIRGGDFNSLKTLCRSSARNYVYTTNPGGRPVTVSTDPEVHIGFRVVCELP